MRAAGCVLLLLCCIALAGCARPNLDTESTVATANAQGLADRDTVPSNQPPTTLLQATPSGGLAPLHVVLALSARDPEGDAMTFSLDPGDGSAPLTGSRLPAAFSHDYGAGEHRAVLTVSDGKESSTASLTLHVANGPPAPPAPPPLNGGDGGHGGGGGAGGADGRGAEGPPAPPATSSTTATSASASTTSSASSSTSSGNACSSPNYAKHHQSECRSSTSASTSSGPASSTSSSASTTSSGSSTSTSTGSSTSSSTSQTQTSTSSTSTSSTTTTTSSTSSSTSTSSAPNHAPTASLTASQPNGTAPMTVHYAADGADPDGDPLSWSLDVDGDGASDASGTGAELPASIDHTFDQPGTYAALFTVSDGQATATTSTTVVVQ